MEGRKEVSIISHRPVSSRDLEQERLFFCWSVLTILQLVVAFQLILLIFMVKKNMGGLRACF